GPVELVEQGQRVALKAGPPLFGLLAFGHWHVPPWPLRRGYAAGLGRAGERPFGCVQQPLHPLRRVLGAFLARSCRTHGPPLPNVGPRALQHREASGNFRMAGEAHDRGPVPVPATAAGTGRNLGDPRYGYAAAGATVQPSGSWRSTTGPTP